jgi:hypothetical protein
MKLIERVALGEITTVQYEQLSAFLTAERLGLVEKAYSRETARRRRSLAGALGVSAGDADADDLDVVARRCPRSSSGCVGSCSLTRLWLEEEREWRLVVRHRVSVGGGPLIGVPSDRFDHPGIVLSRPPRARPRPQRTNTGDGRITLKHLLNMYTDQRCPEIVLFVDEAPAA